MVRTSAPPLRLGLAGLSHDHIDIVSQLSPADFEIVGLWDSDPALLDEVARRFGIAASLCHTDLASMLEAVRPDGVAAFGPIDEHLAVVEAAAPLGIHVMVEKPLAVSVADAERMVDLARDHGIILATNYETSWYASNAELFRIVRDGAIGRPWKVVVRDGHRGPIESGCRGPFLAWLIDPAKSGGGALTDFGCYGANILTFMMEGRLPRSVTARTRRVKPDLYRNVEDDALVVLDYDGVEAVIEASWNWPFARKDMDVYGSIGMASAPDAQRLIVRAAGDVEPRELTPPPLPHRQSEPFAYFAALIRGEERLSPEALAAPENNLAVVRILAAARESASTGRTIALA